MTDSAHAPLQAGRPWPLGASCTGTGVNFAVWAPDATAVELILLGGKGNISVTANVAPRDMSDLCAAAMRGDADTARALHEKLMPLNKTLFIESNPIPVKWALHEMGMMPDGIRLPLTWLSEACHEPLRQAMRQSGVLV